MDNRPIGILDSGIGGLTVLKKIMEILPNEQYIYYADTDHVPYGTKSKEMIMQYTLEAVKFLISKQVKAIVVACNTATSVAIEDLRKQYSIPIIGTEPAAKPAVEQSNGKKVMLIATPTTIREEKLKLLLEKLHAQDIVDLVALPKLVEFAEEGNFESEEVMNYLQEQLRPYHLKEYAVLVLGCTHFPFFKKILTSIFPKETQILDGSFGIAHQLRSRLEKQNLLGNQTLQIEYWNSGRKVTDTEKLSKLLHQL